MAWVFGIGFFILFLFLFPAFRKIALIAGAIIIVIIIILIVVNDYQQKAAKSLIPISKIQVSNLTLRRDFGDSYVINGEIRNNSNSNLTGLVATVKAYDCPGFTIDSNCIIIGEDDHVNLLLLGNVPSNQVRAIDDTYVSFSNMPAVKGNFLWAYEIIGTEGK
jgi:hypothetical protein